MSGIQQDFRGANNYRPNVIGEVMVPKRSAHVQNWFNRAGVVDADRSEPAVRQRRRATRIAGRTVWQVDFAASKRFAMPWRSGNLEFRAEFFNLFNRTNFRAPNGNIEPARRSGRSRRPTIRGSFSSG